MSVFWPTLELAYESWLGQWSAWSASTADMGPGSVMLAGFKQSRASVDMAPIESLSAIMAGIDLVSVRWVSVEERQADDVVASLVVREAGRRVFIMSADRDLYQVVSDTVLILNTRPRRGRLLTGPEDIVSRYGLSPAQWCDYCADGRLVR